MRISDWSSDVCSSDLAAEDKTAGSGNNATGSRGAVVAPIHLSTTYERDEEGNFSSGYMYTRHGNPNRGALERCLAALAGGEEAACFASGSAAAMAVFQALQPGDHVIVRSEAHTSELQSLMRTSYAVFRLKNKKHTS